MDVISIMRKVPVIPVMVIEDVNQAVPLAKALVDGGLNVLEITLRTPAALQAIESIANTVDGAVVGVGTLTKPGEVRLALNAGAEFAVSPGFTSTVAESCGKAGLALLPGVATSSDILRALEFGFDALKFFPAAAAGGTAYLKSLVGPFSGVNFCPTGGIGPSNYHEYLSLSNVVCVGGSWVCPEKLIKERDWDKITALAAACHYPA